MVQTLWPFSKNDCAFFNLTCRSWSEMLVLQVKIFTDGWFCLSHFWAEPLRLSESAVSPRGLSSWFCERGIFKGKTLQTGLAALEESTRTSWCVSRGTWLRASRRSVSPFRTQHEKKSEYLCFLHSKLSKVPLERECARWLAATHFVAVLCRNERT